MKERKPKADDASIEPEPAKQSISNMVALRVPGKDKNSKLEDAGCGFVDTVSIGDEEKQVLHLVPHEVPKKGSTIMVFPIGNTVLPEGLKSEGRSPGFVVYAGEKPVGSAWKHEGSKGKFLVSKINKEVKGDGRLTIFPRLTPK